MTTGNAVKANGRVARSIRQRTLTNQILKHFGIQTPRFSVAQLDTFSNVLPTLRSAGLDQRRAVESAVYAAGVEPLQLETGRKTLQPGGAYTSKRNKDGTYHIYAVDCAVEFDKRIVDKETGKEKFFPITTEWYEDYIEQAHRRLRRDKYIAPLHVNHHVLSPQQCYAGKVLPRRVVQGNFEGKTLGVLQCDFLFVDQWIYETILAGRMSYRSVEIWDVREKWVDSIALLDHEPPFFRLANLTIGRELDPFRNTQIAASASAARPAVSSVKRLPKKFAPTYAYRTVGADGICMLQNLGGHTMAGKRTKAKAAGKPTVRASGHTDENEDKNKDVEAQVDSEELIAAMDTIMEGANAIMEGVKSAKAALGAEVEEEAAEEETVEPSEDEAVEAALAELDKDETTKEEPEPTPVKTSKKPRAKVEIYNSANGAKGADKETAAALGRAEARIDKLERKDNVKALLGRLSSIGMLTDERRQKVTTFLKKGESGLVAADAYIGALEENAGDSNSFDVDTDDVTVAGSGSAGRGDKDVSLFTKLGADATKRASKLAKEFDGLKDSGQSFMGTRAAFIRDELIADGVKGAEKIKLETSAA